MEIKNKLIAILAILCVMCSACAVSAADDVSYQSAHVYLGESQDGQDLAIIPPDNTHSEDQQNAAGGVEEHDGVPYHADGTNPTGNATGNATGHAAGAPATGNATGNATGHAAGANATGNSTHATANHKLPATGNPILALMAVCTLLGGYTLLRKK